MSSLSEEQLNDPTIGAYFTGSVLPSTGIKKRGLI